jgi:CDP-diacylglycerol--glycerol-3-phosphate 3-phosphatidyltransferase
MPFQLRKEHLPWGMASGRAALGPILIAGQACNWSGVALASLVLSALLSDIFDGVLARRWKCDTAGVRLFDSMAYTFFYLCVGIALCIGQPQLWRSNTGLICALLAAEAAKFIFDYAKFGKPSSYHSWLAKSWGLLLAIAVMATFASHHGASLIRASVIVGIVCNAEGLAMSIILPARWRDVRSLFRAWKIRRETLDPRASRKARSLRIVNGAEKPASATSAAALRAQ